MAISLDEVQHVARLARLQLDEVELLAFQSELNALLGHFQDIQGLQVAGLETKPETGLSGQIVLAPDEPLECLDRSEVLRTAPVTRAGLFVVPTIIGD